MAGEEEPKDNTLSQPWRESAGEMLARRPIGPRIAALEIGGWDTHAAQVARLTDVLKQLDAGLVALKTGAGAGVAADGGAGDDRVRPHRAGERDEGHRPRHRRPWRSCWAARWPAGACWATWPGLGAGQLFENRDLAPTTDLRSVAKGMLRGHLGLDDAVLAQVFPASGTASPIGGLLRA